MEIIYEIAGHQHLHYAEQLCRQYEESAKTRGTGIAVRKPEYIISKMEKGHAIIAIDGQKLAGFCYIETWGHGEFVANSGLIVLEPYRKMGLARNIKSKAFRLARLSFPQAYIFGITTSSAVMKINWELGYRPVAFTDLTRDDAFWDGCRSCPNYNILQNNKRLLCLCTAMLAPPLEAPATDYSQKDSKEKYSPNSQKENNHEQ